jgi:hypothetical protein
MPTPNIQSDLSSLKRTYVIRFCACVALLLWGLLWVFYVAPRAGEYQTQFSVAAWLFVVMGMVLPIPTARWFRRLLSAVNGGEWVPCEFRITITRGLDERRCVAQITDPRTGRQSRITLLSAPDRTPEQNDDLMTGLVLRERNGDRLPMAVKGDGPVYWAQSSMHVNASAVAIATRHRGDVTPTRRPPR